MLHLPDNLSTPATAHAMAHWPPHVPAAAVRTPHGWLAAHAAAPRVLPSHATRADVLAWCNQLTPRDPDAAPAAAWLSYDAGRLLEPAATHTPPARADRPWPLGMRVELSPPQAGAPVPGRFRVGPMTSASGQEAFEAGVARVLDFIRAGDVYQVNLAHRLSASFEGCPRALFATLLNTGDPRHGGYLEHAEADQVFVVASASPELFLARDATTLRTRPMKGTARPGANTLATPKDHAELNMIVDLMRNDLGRVCDLGSIRVEQTRSLETHAPGPAALLQATATIAGTLPAQTPWSELLNATFPGGSVTGAPKIRAMQIIDAIEPARRGPYCGTLGLWTRDNAQLNITIRTACITGARTPGTAAHIASGTLDWWVGAGIVADSHPRHEWEETLAKAGVLHAALARS